jgi:hypothetical protein
LRSMPYSRFWLRLLAAALLLAPAAAGAQTCARTLTADVVALDQVFFWNRLGAVQPQGMMYALRRDVVAFDGSANLTPGNVQLRPGKRPRPLVLRMNVGDCLTINFQNLLDTARLDQDQAATRKVSIHVIGMQRVNLATGSWDPGASTTYTYYAEREGENLIFSAGAMAGGEGDGGTVNAGLFGSIVVGPAAEQM